MLKSCKLQKVDKQNKLKNAILRIQRKEKDYWDKYEDFSLESNSNKSECNGFSFALSSSDKKEEERKKMKDNKKEKDISKGLGDDKGGILLETRGHICKSICRDDASTYLYKVRKCGLSVIRKREIRRKKK